MSVLVLLTIIHLSTSPSSTFSIWQQHKTATSKWTFCLNKKIDVWQVFICFLAHQQSDYIVTNATRPLPTVYLFTKGEGKPNFIHISEADSQQKLVETSKEPPSLPAKAEVSLPCTLPGACHGLPILLGQAQPQLHRSPCQKLQSRTFFFLYFVVFSKSQHKCKPVTGLSPNIFSVKIFPLLAPQPGLSLVPGAPLLVWFLPF